MSKKSKNTIKGPWKSIHSAIWLIGLGIIALNDWWWPGILFLVAISMISQAVIQSMAPDREQSIRPFAEIEPLDEESLKAASSKDSVQPAYSTHRLPSECLKCGAPIHGAEVRWTGPESADCPYCGANLPLRKT
ncbi:MAG: hypothetical protein JW908_07415 [Anaerolineales bacterium]|nr:hypothetical protein [Anaerolineales bacterium]